MLIFLGASLKFVTENSASLQLTLVGTLYRTFHHPEGLGWRWGFPGKNPPHPTPRETAPHPGSSQTLSSQITLPNLKMDVNRITQDTVLGSRLLLLQVCDTSVSPVPCRCCPAVRGQARAHGRLGCFLCLALPHQAARNIVTLVFVWTYAFVSLGQTLRRRMAGSYGRCVCLTFSETAKPSLRVAVPFCLSRHGQRRRAPASRASGHSYF